MECVVCHREGGYNRAVVGLASGVELGGLCVDCEREAFGELVEEPGATSRETCLFCGRDGLWAMPKWLPSTYEAEGRTVSYVDYDATGASIRVCDEHLASIGVDPVPGPAAGGKEKELTPRIGED